MASALAAAPPPEMATLVEGLVVLVGDVSAMREFTGVTGALCVECVRLVRKISLLSHLLQEIQDSASNAGAACVAASSSYSRAASPVSCLADLLFAVEAVKRFLQLVSGSGSDFAGKNIALQLQYVTWQLEKVLRNLPYDIFGISDEIREELTAEFIPALIISKFIDSNMLLL